jgi:hypothetical protein
MDIVKMIDNLVDGVEEPTRSSGDGEPAKYYREAPDFREIDLPFMILQLARQAFFAPGVPKTARQADGWQRLKFKAGPTPGTEVNYFVHSEDGTVATLTTFEGKIVRILMVNADAEIVEENEEEE